MEIAKKRYGLVEAEDGSLDPKASPFLRVGDKLRRVHILSFDEIKAVKKDKMIAILPSIGEKVVVFANNFRLKPGQGFGETIVWAKRAPLK